MKNVYSRVCDLMIVVLMEVVGEAKNSKCLEILRTKWKPGDWACIQLKKSYNMFMYSLHVQEVDKDDLRPSSLNLIYATPFVVSDIRK